MPFTPGRRFGPDKPVFVLTSGTTFSGGEELAYDLQQLGRATVVGERTRGGAHPVERFRIRGHLQATIPVARSLSPLSGGNWEGTGVLPDVSVRPATRWTRLTSGPWPTSCRWGRAAPGVRRPRKRRQALAVSSLASRPQGRQARAADPGR